MIFWGGTGFAAAQTEVSSGFHFDWWASDDDDSGLQFYIPVQVSSQIRDVSIELLSAYVYTKVDPSAGSAESLIDFSDTKLNFAYQIIDEFTFDILLGLGFNLPTGKTDLSEDELVLVVPPDLFSITTYGEGLNINPTITLANQWDRWVAGVGIGYTWRGKYDYSETIEDYDPGDMITVTGEVGHDFSSQWFGKLYGQFVTYDTDTLDGDDFYEEGDVVLIGAGLRYDRDIWDLAFSLNAIFRDKSKVLQGTALPTEERNSHGDEYVSRISYRYLRDDATMVRTSVEVLLLQENDYASTSPFYVGKRQKITLGAGLDKTLRQDLKASFDISGFFMNDDKNWYHPDEDLKFRGFSLSACITKQF
ncbi:MAG: hypothetical protein ACP5G0_13285 [Desulfomonilia bacterium]